MEIRHDQLTSSYFGCGVKNDAMVFIFPSFKLTFWIIFMIWYFHCIFSSKVLEDI